MSSTNGPDASGRRPPPAPIRLIGKGINRLIARWPATWPLLRRPVRRFFDRLATGWDERVQPDSPEHLAALAAALDRLETTPRRALDVGTGTGAGALALARWYPEAQVVGVDISPRMIVAAQAKIPKELAGRVEFSVADAGSLPFENESFDLVAQISVPAFFDEVTRVLAPGGYVVVVSSLGEKTPFHTPERVVRDGFARRGVTEVATGSGGRGTYFLGRRSRPGEG